MFKYVFGTTWRYNNAQTICKFGPEDIEMHKLSRSLVWTENKEA